MSRSEDPDYASAEKRALTASSIEVTTRQVRVGDGRALHVLEAGDGDPPVILVHGGGTNAVQWLPLLEQLDSRRLIAFDRPGFGLSDPVDYRSNIRHTATSILTGLLDALSLPQADLIGNSMGSIWNTWLALDRPSRVRRLVHVGSVPLLPGFHVPVPLRIMSVPGVGEVLSRVMMSPNAASVRRMFANFGEEETIVQHEWQVETIAAMYASDTSRGAMLGEQRAIISPLGARPEHMFSDEDLQRVRQPTLFIWGDDDPIATVEVGRTAVRLMPRAQLEVLPAGHMPWLGESERTADLISNFLEAD